MIGFVFISDVLSFRMFTENNMPQKIVKLTVKDVRFPTSLEHHGSDAMVSYYYRKSHADIS